jgi:hypothetical protein
MLHFLIILFISTKVIYLVPKKYLKVKNYLGSSLWPPTPHRYCRRGRGRLEANNAMNITESDVVAAMAMPVREGLVAVP